SDAPHADHRTPTHQARTARRSPRRGAPRTRHVPQADPDGRPAGQACTAIVGSGSGDALVPGPPRHTGGAGGAAVSVVPGAAGSARSLRAAGTDRAAAATRGTRTRVGTARTRPARGRSRHGEGARPDVEDGDRRSARTATATGSSGATSASATTAAGSRLKA